MVCLDNTDILREFVREDGNTYQEAHKVVIDRQTYWILYVLHIH